MTDFRFETDDIEDPEIVSEFSMDDYEKYRLKTSDLTIDLAIVDLNDRDKDEYIQERKNELNDRHTEVPHPYKPEKQGEKKEDTLVEFNDNPTGRGFTDPEYNLVSEDGGELVRFRYTITWTYFPSKEKLAEIEVYSPYSSNQKTEITDIAESLKIK